MLSQIPNLKRIEVTPKDEMSGLLSHMTHAVYPHDELYGDFIPVHTYVNCPPEKVFAYMSDPYSLEEWSYSVRDFKPSHLPGVLVGEDRIGKHTKIYCRTHSDPNALIVDYHCAWDQGDDLWMIYLNRIVPAERVLNKPGSVIFWQNCRHPYYDKNPYPETAPDGRPVWVGDFWDLFYAGHAVELENLKRILEYREQNACHSH
ncbi:MAG TPA: hypothetical protein VE954_15990 [Oligoflexus sp.]|uniref:hypothetical protein n=1 Tax=Oligoflexus sp. TaxID=1971216 RepID=UPI002D37F1AD|nr:hypothetical protein [Oligoflexus sp.]HYX34601.1 hypothetical protein [Oligoflexus sp.]